MYAIASPHRIFYIFGSVPYIYIQNDKNERSISVSPEPATKFSCSPRVQKSDFFSVSGCKTALATQQFSNTFPVFTSLIQLVLAAC